MDPAILTLCVLGVAAFFFATELIPLAVTAMGSSVALGLLGVLTPKQVFSGLSNSTVVLFAGMFVIGAAMFQTGLAQKIGMTVVRSAGSSEKRLMAYLMIITVLLSAISSNTATVACLMPVVIQICAAARVSVSKQLMALAVAANVGGTITMIGTPPNILMSGALQAAGFRPFGFFEYAWYSASHCSNNIHAYDWQ
ncbi:Na+/H+ antiporter NhaD/arsenite permease-like protein [Pectinatus brassicae]|uniref:Na+/H+ antiporter NhaD/arsenite permease-like protein n=1 Tax=Pectinatus brassicae TaxID=862415 RepID=A0A840URT8_9FIRM|nr:Na+/H+ antiporter NhaD/arsenite permease-like protein [Pectinatus brassicae]